MKTPAAEKAGNAAKIADSLDVDEAMVVMEHLETIEIDEATNKRLLRTIDLHILPIMCAVYCMNFLDKTAISYASVMGIRSDLHPTGDNYLWLASIFYFGYLAWEYPTTRLLQRLPIAKYSGFCVIVWGATLALFGAVRNFQGELAIRFLLGASEAGVTPGWTLTPRNGIRGWSKAQGLEYGSVLTAWPKSLAVSSLTESQKEPINTAQLSGHGRLFLFLLELLLRH